MARILIADDEPEVRKALVRMVTEAGHQSMETSDGLGALYDTKELAPDVLLLDWMIPELTGGDVLHALRNDPNYGSVSHTPVIIVSDFVEESSRDTFLRAGANAFVAKRDDLDGMKRELLSTIDCLITQTL
ncbi:MAG: response regulator [Candidatus Hydrogenedentes bacterium]|nr:response regulator [Candidatus Hydrogenedentota bacterium]